MLDALFPFFERFCYAVVGALGLIAVQKAPSILDRLRPEQALTLSASTHRSIHHRGLIAIPPDLVPTEPFAKTPASTAPIASLFDSSVDVLANNSFFVEEFSDYFNPQKMRKLIPAAGLELGAFIQVNNVSKTKTILLDYLSVETSYFRPPEQLNDRQFVWLYQFIPKGGEYGDVPIVELKDVLKTDSSKRNLLDGKPAYFKPQSPRAFSTTLIVYSAGTYGFRFRIGGEVIGGSRVELVSNDLSYTCLVSNFEKGAEIRSYGI